MADIVASAPVTAPAVGSIVYDKWFLTKLTGKIDATKAPLILTLQRAAKTDTGWLLMPVVDEKSEVSFKVDIYKEAATTPEIAAAMEAFKAAIIAYATKNKLL